MNPLAIIAGVVAAAAVLFAGSGKVDVPGEGGGAGDGKAPKAGKSARAARKLSPQDSFLEGKKAGEAEALLKVKTENDATAARQKEIDLAVDARVKAMPKTEPNT